MNLAMQSKEVAIVLSCIDWALDMVDDFQNALVEWLNINADTYFFIWHLMDNQEDGTPKTPHLHIVARMQKRARLGTILNGLRLAVGCNKNAISIEKPTSFDSCVQYLIHKNNPEKYQYPLEDVVTNLPGEELALIMESEATKFDAVTLLRLCKEADSMTEIMLKIGLGLFNHYRPTIKLIFEENHLRVAPDGTITQNVRLSKSA